MSSAPRPSEPFVMHVQDIFVLEDGRTAFVGLIDGGDKVIRSCRCELWCDGTLLVYGEMLPDGGSRKERVLSCMEPVELKKAQLPGHVYELRYHGDTIEVICVHRFPEV
jgi:hypothetical protein